VLDGFAGRVIINPTEETLAAYERLRERYRARVEERRSEAHLQADTPTGRTSSCAPTLSSNRELEQLGSSGSEGIGLFRTEMLLLASGRPLDEEEQLQVYSEGRPSRPLPHPTTFRLVDLGGDKMLPMAHREHNPFLGWRGVRILLDRDEILRPQLRAIMRVAVEGPVRLLIPMVSSLDEVYRVRDIWRSVAQELRDEGVDHQDDVPIGIMVEVPVVALAPDRYAAEVDFMSIGTNDLTQFLLAVDRGNDMVAGRYRELHPVVLRLIRDVVLAGRRRNIPVSLCGEMAGNPRIAPLLVGLGLCELSASPTFLPDIKLAIRSTSLADAEALAAQALEQPDAQSVQTLTAQWMREHIPELAPYFDGNPDFTPSSA
jgi:phosphoenolpyruvate-protein phosphotransferase (PTS system enzyme I)